VPDFSAIVRRNPTGSVYPPDHLEALAAVLRQHPNVLIVSDEIYEKITCVVCPLLTVPQHSRPSHFGPVSFHDLRRYDVPHVAFGALEGMFERYAPSTPTELTLLGAKVTARELHLTRFLALPNAEL
jgi:hypothetical protein